MLGIIEHETIRNGQKVVQVRSNSGKLLFIKTKAGYEIKCPRSKTVYLIPYEQMVTEYLTRWG